ncbi:glycosyltransferase family 2 protein [Gluconobacter sphaericus]|uniref:glycosyltransferase family 2 protein n=1 Tax=Gluconobacter sphaericus TaxID=574987 RepID=UPI001B8ABC5C|nr:glycosyltransferase family 2 protein [Gluconobacter sphaericus]MBS1097242.1 glycosyltransferase family 2 protein [Gluconobacter sphaericus]
MEFFHLKTFHGTTLFFCSEDRILKHSNEKQASYIDVVIAQSSENPAFFIVAPVNIGEDVEKIYPEENALFKDRFFVFETGFQNNNKLSLLSLEEKKFFSADPFGNLAFNRDESREWEFFFLSPNQVTIDEKSTAIFNEINNFISNKNNIEKSIFEISLSNKNIRVEIFNIFIRSLNATRRKIFSKILTTAFLNLPDENYFNILEIINYIPHAEWVHRTLLELAQWNMRRNGCSIRKAAGEYDFLGYGHIRDRGNGIYWGSIILGIAREAIESRQDIALLATARDEGIYFLEWIAHHRVIGIKDFFIYTNDNTDGSDALLQVLAKNGEITWINNTGNHIPGINMQYKAYNHALTTLPEILDFRWCAVVDIDEAILPSQGSKNSILPIISARDEQGVDCFFLSWRVYYPNNHLTWSNGLSADRFIEGDKHPLVKSIFKTNLFNYSYAHHPECSYSGRIYATVDGNIYSQNQTTNEDLNFTQTPTEWAHVCHYHLRSFEEYIWKFSRGENDGKGVIKNKHFRYNNPAIFDLFAQTFKVEGVSTASRLSEDIYTEVRRLLKIPGVSDAIQEIISKYHKASAVFVEESLQSMLLDDRIDSHTKQTWENLCSLWRQERLKKESNINKNIP